MQLDGFCRALVNAGPALNTILGVGRSGSIFFDFIDFAGAYLYAISTTIAFVSVNNRIHDYFKFQISNPNVQSPT